MSMEYDPIKVPLGRFFNRNPLLRKIFYSLLNILLLRSWHVRKALKETGALMSPSAEVLDAGMGFGQYSWWMTKRFPGWQITAADIKSEQVADCNAFFTAAGVADSVKAVEADLVTWNRNEKYDLSTVRRRDGTHRGRPYRIFKLFPFDEPGWKAYNFNTLRQGRL